ncbi:MAG: energy transducer TonB [Terracidiphilus sp.]|jgi:TonB family protein
MTILFPALLMLAAGTAWAQQELAPQTDQGPLAIKPLPAGQAAAVPNPAAQQTPSQQPNTPDADGVYRLGPGIAPPELIVAVPAHYPPEALETDRPHVCILSVVVGVDGNATSVHVANPNAGPFDEKAVAAVKESQFQPATLNGKPVPVLIQVRVPFFHLATPIPRIIARSAQFANRTQAWQNDPLQMRNGVMPPRPINFANPEYSDEARRKRIQGVVLVSALVNEEGNPIDFRVEKSLGYGLDEKAVECVSQYRFTPAMRDGQPVAARVTIEVNFRLY